MKHVVIGTILGLMMMTCACTSVKTDSFEYNSPFEHFAKIFKPSEHIGPVTGERARYSRALFVAQTTGDTSRLNDYARRQRNGDLCIPYGFSSTRKAWSNPDRDAFYFYKGEVLPIPLEGTAAYRQYLRRVKK